MSFLKSSKFWSVLALVASIACVLSMFWVLYSFRTGAEGVSFRSAGEDLRTLVQIGVGVFVFALVTLIVARKDKTALLISALAAVLVFAPVAWAIALNPTQINPPAAPQQAGGMGAPDGMGAGGAPRTPPLNDISTDTLDPPQYHAVASIRPEGSNVLEYPANGPELQAQLFPDIAPIESELTSDEAFDRALSVANSMRWDVVHEDKATGLIEAVSTTFFFGFKDDVVIRVRESGAGSIVDIRSHSRVGRGDRGKNAERVRAFIDKF